MPFTKLQAFKGYGYFKNKIIDLNVLLVEHLINQNKLALLAYNGSLKGIKGKNLCTGIRSFHVNLSNYATLGIAPSVAKSLVDLSFEAHNLEQIESVRSLEISFPALEFLCLCIQKLIQLEWIAIHTYFQ